MVELLSLEIKDYRQYEGKADINLQTSKNKNINVIEGQNGAGKSNLLNAITLCFYGRELHQEATAEDMEKLPLVSETKLDELSTGESASGYVEVVLGNDQPEFLLRREFTTFKVADTYNDDIGQLKLQRRAGNQYNIVEDPSKTLNQILPARVKDYFLFDGEALTSFFESGYKNRVEDAIVDVSHIGLLNSSISNLGTVKDEIRRKAGKLEGRPKEIKEQIDEIEEEIEEKREQKERYVATIAEYDQEIEKIKEKLRGAANDEAKELVRDRDQLENEISNLKSKREEHYTDAANLLNEAGPPIFANEALEYTLNQIKSLEEDGQLPPKIQDWFIDELIERGECICGRGLDDDSSSKEHLRQLLDNVSEVSTDNLDGKSEIPRIKRDGNNWAEELREERANLSEVRKDISKKDNDLGEIKAKLETFDVPTEINVSELSKQQDEFETRKSDLSQKVGQLEAKIEAREKDLKSKEEELKKEMRKQGRHDEIVTQVEFADGALEEMEEIRENILSRIRSDTEKNLNQYFNELIWKEDKYSITFADDYSIEISAPDNTDNRIGSLSAGEKQVLALSFMAALSDISGFNAPIIIDTPLGRISSDPRKLIAENLPNYLENTQITFLMTDEEYTEEVKGMMKHNVSNEYELDFEGGVTEVVHR